LHGARPHAMCTDRQALVAQEFKGALPEIDFRSWVERLMLLHGRLFRGAIRSQCFSNIR
jgi:hypothetical protein